LVDIQFRQFSLMNVKITLSRALFLITNEKLEKSKYFWTYSETRPIPTKSFNFLPFCLQKSIIILPLYFLSLLISFFFVIFTPLFYYRYALSIHVCWPTNYVLIYNNIMKLEGVVLIPKRKFMGQLCLLGVPEMTIVW